MPGAAHNLNLNRRTVWNFAARLRDFTGFGQATKCLTTTFPWNGGVLQTPTFVNEFWTARQRQASSLHEISYRACFKPQLPRFFIEHLTRPGDVVYDPFMGRGTTPIEAALLGRIPWGNDLNPLSLAFTQPRLQPPHQDQVEQRLSEMDWGWHAPVPEELLVFYHPETLRELSALKRHFQQTLSTPVAHLENPVDAWLRLVALNRLTGHSAGFFSVYTLPPNQAVSVAAQRRINARRRQTPPRREVAPLLLKKSRQLLGDVTETVRSTLRAMAAQARFTTGPAAATPALPDASVALIVTSPPFLNVVQYATDNWLRCWFLGIDPHSIKLTTPRKLADWAAAMTEVLRELHRVLQPGGFLACEVGEVHGSKTRLEETVLPCGVAAGLDPVLVLINDQAFTKTANCWGVNNMSKGTNTNRIVLFQKPGRAAAA